MFRKFGPDGEGTERGGWFWVCSECGMDVNVLLCEYGHKLLKLRGYASFVKSWFFGGIGCEFKLPFCNWWKDNLPLRTFLTHFWAGVAHVHVCACLRTAYRITSHDQGAWLNRKALSALIDQPHAPESYGLLVVFAYGLKSEQGLSWGTNSMTRVAITMLTAVCYMCVLSIFCAFTQHVRIVTGSSRWLVLL